MWSIFRRAEEKVDSFCGEGKNNMSKYEIVISLEFRRIEI
jgi:hypothetical protein